MKGSESGKQKNRRGKGRRYPQIYPDLRRFLGEGTTAAGVREFVSGSTAENPKRNLR
jgi:hypothetical protein